MKFYVWADVKVEHVTPLATRQIIRTDTMIVIRRRLMKGWQGDLHTHRDEQMCMVEQGKLRCLIDGKEQITGSAEALVIPSNVPHSLEALEDTVLTDLFSTPPEKPPPAIP